MKWLDSRVMVKKPMAEISSLVLLGSGDGVGTISKTNPMNSTTTSPQIINPTSYPRTHPMTVALRRVAYYWPEAHAKLLSMPWEWSDKIPFGATNGKRLFFNRTGLNRLAARDAGPGLIAFLLVHEALHVLLRHRQRFAHLRWKRTLNVATDYVVNAMIVRRNRELKREIFPPIQGIYLDESFSGHKSIEQIYRELILAKLAERQKASQSKTIRLLLRSRRRNRHVRSSHACPSSRNLSGVSTGSIASRGGHGAGALGAFGACGASRGVAKLGAAAASQKFAGGRASRDATARISVSGAGSTRGGGLGGCRASDPTAGITVSGLPATARADPGRGRADDPSRSIADYSALRARRLLLALDGLNHPPRSVTNHLPAGLCA